VTFSGDKLLGGPQIGVIAGSKMLIDRMRSHQLHRALRVDKLTLAAFEATLRMYLTGRQGEIPVIKMIETDQDTLLKKARKLCRTLKEIAQKAGAGDMTIAVIETDDAIGGGAFPTDRLPGFGVGVQSASISAENLALALRTAAVPVIPGIRDGLLILHLRTLLDGDEGLLAASFASALGAVGG
jgi:L-seryl-tRNA(Ser) seleniumtransferase